MKKVLEKPLISTARNGRVTMDPFEPTIPENFIEISSHQNPQTSIFYQIGFLSELPNLADLPNPPIIPRPAQEPTTRRPDWADIYVPYYTFF